MECKIYMDYIFFIVVYQIWNFKNLHSRSRRLSLFYSIFRITFHSFRWELWFKNSFIISLPSEASLLQFYTEC